MEDESGECWEVWQRERASRIIDLVCSPRLPECPNRSVDFFGWICWHEANDFLKGYSKHGQLSKRAYVEKWLVISGVIEPEETKTFSSKEMAVNFDGWKVV